MSEKRRGKGAGAAWAVLAPLLLLALYLLSPVAVALTGNFLNARPDGWVYRAYAPLRWARHNTPQRASIDRYSDFLMRLEGKGRMADR